MRDVWHLPTDPKVRELLERIVRAGEMLSDVLYQTAPGYERQQCIAELDLLINRSIRYVLTTFDPPPND